MTDLSRLFNVTIGRQTRAAQYGVFGVGALFAPAAAFYGLTAATYQTATLDQFNKLYRVYSGETAYDTALADGMNGDNLEAVADYFAQTPKPNQVVVFDASAAMQTFKFALSGVPVKDGAAGVVATIGYVDDNGYHYATYDGTAWDGSTGDADTNIVADSTVAGQFTLSGRIVYLEGATINQLDSVAIPAAAQSMIADLKAQYSLWFMGFTTYTDLDTLKEMADWTETQSNKMFAFKDDYLNAADWAADNITKYLQQQNYAGSFAFTTKTPGNFLDAAISGRCLVMAPGSETWAIKTLSGVTTDPWTETEWQDIKALNGNTFEDYGSNVIATYPGVTGSGEPIEVVRGCFWLADLIQKDQATLFINRNKIPVSPEGVESVCMKLEASLKKGQTAGVVSEDFKDSDGNIVKGFTVVRPTMDEISAVQRINGELPVQFQFYISYAIRKLIAVGTGQTYGI